MKIACSHCHLAYEKDALFSAEIDGKTEYFCCKGCEGVFRILQENNLAQFYEKLGSATLTPPKAAQNAEHNDDLSRFDSESFAKKYIKTLKNADGGESCEVALIILGIHCVACVWLNQKLLNAANGVLSADINYTNNKAKITFDKAKISLSQIISKIRSVGYDAMIYDPKNLESINAKIRRDYYTRLIVAIFCSMNIMWIAVAQYLGYFLGMEGEVKNILNLAGFALSAPTLFYSGFIFFKGGYFGLKNRIVNMDLLVALGASSTFFYSIYAALTHSGETYFESVTMIVTFILAGKFLEVRAKKGAGDVVDSLTNEIPAFVSVIRGAKVEKIAPEEVQIGDIIELLPGEKLAIDGVLLSESATLDTSMLTGESAFVFKKRGEVVLSGSINLEHHIRLKAAKTFESSTMSHIIALLQDAMAKKPRIEERANAISYHFSLFVLAIAAATFTVWASFSGAENALTVALSVIIIACPCALALATPIATIVGISEAYKMRLLFKEARFLESFAKTTAIIFDKTGTLTHGRPKVVRCEVLGDFDSALLAEFVRRNNHPISKAIAEFLQNEGANLAGNLAESSGANLVNLANLAGQNAANPPNLATLANPNSPNSANLANHANPAAPKSPPQDDLQNFRIVPQRGIVADFRGEILLGGSARFMRENGVECEDSPNDFMCFYYAVGGVLRAIFWLEDSLREDALETVAAFQRRGFRVAILSGDRAAVVAKTARTLNIAEFYSDQSPEDKSKFLEKLRSEGQICAFVGDGINDAIALHKADIAVAMGRGSDIALDSSDIVLLDGRLKNLAHAHDLALKTYRIIRQNIRISILYNALTIPLATLGLIIPLFAALSMSLSSILVVLNSLRIRARRA